VRELFSETYSSLKPLIGFSPNFTVMILGWSQGKKIGFQNAIFKNLFIRNFKAQSFHIWNIASFRGLLQRVFKLCPWGKKMPPPRGSQFYIE